MKCSHNIPLEYNCAACYVDAMKRVRQLKLQPPPMTASREQKQEFWSKVYREAVAETPNPAY